MQNTIDGPTAGYTITGNQTGDQKIGAVPFSYAFSTGVSLNEGYEWVSGQAPTINNATGVTSTIGEQTEITTISGAQVVQSISNTTATLEITYNINGPEVWSPAGYPNGYSKAGLPGASYSFADQTPTISIPSGFGYSVPPSTVGDLTGTFDATNKVIPVTVTATVIEVQQTGTVQVAFSNNVDGSQYTTTSIVPGASITGNIGDTYSFTRSVNLDPGYTWSPGPIWTPSAQLTGTITQTGTTTITQSLSGTVVAVPSCKTYEVYNDAGPGYGAFVYADCRSGNTVTGQVPYGDSIEVCSRVGEISGGSVTIIETGDC